MTTKLYEVPRMTPIEVEGEKYLFDHLDGMYSVCYNHLQQVVHLAAWTEVTILNEDTP